MFYFILVCIDQLNRSDEMFVSDSSAATPIGALCEQFKEIGQRLLNHYVRVQGQIISQVSGCSTVCSIPTGSLNELIKRVILQKSASFSFILLCCVEVVSSKWD